MHLSRVFIRWGRGPPGNIGITRSVGSGLYRLLTDAPVPVAPPPLPLCALPWRLPRLAVWALEMGDSPVGSTNQNDRPKYSVLGQKVSTIVLVATTIALNIHHPASLGHKVITETNAILLAESPNILRPVQTSSIFGSEISQRCPPYLPVPPPVAIPLDCRLARPTGTLQSFLRSFSLSSVVILFLCGSFLCAAHLDPPLKIVWKGSPSSDPGAIERSQARWYPRQGIRRRHHLLHHRATFRRPRFTFNLTRRTCTHLRSSHRRPRHRWR